MPLLSPTRKRQLTLGPITAAVTIRPTWLQLADGCTPIVIAARIMECSQETAAQRLRSACRALGNPSPRYEGTLKIACEIAGVKLRKVPVCDTHASKPAPAKGDDAIYRARDRHLGTISAPLCAETVMLLPVTSYIDEGNPLRRRIDEAAAAENARAA